MSFRASNLFLWRGICTRMMTVRKNNGTDPNSLANIDAFLTKHISLEWDVDFARSVISGSAILRLLRKDNPGTNGKLLKLDASHLHIRSVKDAESGKPLPFQHDNQASKFGGCLAIEMDTLLGDAVKIEYETTKESSALQWLTPAQTIGKQYPYLFSQCQAIHARTMLPCQDTPAVKATYDARVSVAAPLAVVMSANRRKEIESPDSKKRIFEFEQTQPIPSYLIAIGAGAIESRKIGPRSAVWSERELLEEAAYEFAETEQFIATAEQLVGPYVWERYDILLLPPSFPYGGMENPCLTFLTPSLLCGDRSLVDVVAHEISHSWTGNLVSCCNWEHFWLNEGFTMFLERKILSRVHGEAWRQFNSQIGLADLRESIALFGADNMATALVPDLSETDPDDVFSSVPYEKGYTLLYVLEQLVGGPEVFEPFFKAYVQHYAGKSLVSDEFKAFFTTYFANNPAISQKLAQFPWDQWLHGRGMPLTIPQYDQSMMVPCHSLVDLWLTSPKEKLLEGGHFDNLTVGQKIMFLDLMVQKVNELNNEHFKMLDECYGLSKVRNVEILLKWFLLGIRTRCQDSYRKAAHFATQHGRMKYCRPILRELFKSDPLGREIALETFEKHRSSLHPIAAQLIAKDLQLN